MRQLSLQVDVFESGTMGPLLLVCRGRMPPVYILVVEKWQSGILKQLCHLSGMTGMEPVIFRRRYKKRNRVFLRGIEIVLGGNLL